MEYSSSQNQTTETGNVVTSALDYVGGALLSVVSAPFKLAPLAATIPFLPLVALINQSSAFPAKIGSMILDSVVAPLNGAKASDYIISQSPGEKLFPITTYLNKGVF